MARANVLGPLRWKRAKIHRGSRRRNIGPHHEAGYTSAVVTEPEFVKVVAIGAEGAFLMRGLQNVRAEFSLTALAYNLRRALNILGVEAMMAARPGVTGGAILAGPTHVDDQRVITAGILRQNAQTSLK